MHVEQAILTRRSVRGFLPTPVARETIERIIEVAARAPSGTNIQPWKVYACAGPVRDAIAEETCRAFLTGDQPRENELDAYPVTLAEHFKARRRKVGWDLYGLMGVVKGDREGSRRQHVRNYDFFGAPVALFVFIDRRLQWGSWLDTGMFVQNLMLAARARGLHTCPQAAWRDFHKIVRRHLEVPDDEIMICGMSIGHEDEAVPANELRTEREPLDVYARFAGWD